MAQPTSIAMAMQALQKDSNNSNSTSSASSTALNLTNTTSPGIIRLYDRYGEDGKVLLSEFNPSLQIQYCRDIRKVHMGQAPSIALVGNAYGRRIAETWLEIQLTELSEFAGCKGKLTAHQLTDTARMIIDGYGHFKLTEFMLFFQRFKRCEYGKFYGAVDPMVILQAVREFSEQRSRTIEKFRQEEQRAQAQRNEEEYMEIRRRYIERVPDAFTSEAAISFLQYRLMGYDHKTDEELATEIADIKSGKITIPSDVNAILASLCQAFGNQDMTTNTTTTNISL